MCLPSLAVIRHAKWIAFDPEEFAQVGGEESGGGLVASLGLLAAPVQNPLLLGEGLEQFPLSGGIAVLLVDHAPLCVGDNVSSRLDFDRRFRYPSATRRRPVRGKRVYRLYRGEGLRVWKKVSRRRVARMQREIRAAAPSRDECWSVDFVSDQLFMDGGSGFWGSYVTAVISRCGHTSAMAVPLARSASASRTW
jgi:hypothetical protein